MCLRQYSLAYLFILPALLQMARPVRAQEVKYELVPLSFLDHVHVDEAGNRQLIKVEVQGTFSAILFQFNEGGFIFPSSPVVALRLQDIDFRSVSGPEYRVTGGCAYFLEANRITATGLPGAEVAELNVSINEFKNVRMVTPELLIGRTFPPFSVGLISTWSSDRQWDQFGITFHAVPSSEELTRFFHRGDANGDGEINITDPIQIIIVLFLGGEPLQCIDAADCNDDGEVSVLDPVFLLESLFLGKGKVPVPSLLCGIDPTDDGLGCGGQLGCMTEIPNF
jgi:hypothetical protein